MAKILVIRDSEPLPINLKSKKMRTSLLVDKLLENGHEITWFCSTFDHINKALYSSKDKEISVSDNLTIVMKHAGIYRKNLSYARIKHHKKIGKELSKYLNNCGENFDLILASYPVIELAYESVKFGKKTGTPVIVDVRDKWPDTFVDYMPKIFKNFVQCACLPLSRKAKYTFSNSDKLVSMSEYMLSWAQNKAKRLDKGHVFYLGTSLHGCDREFLSSSGKDVINVSWLGTGHNSYDWNTVLKATHYLDKNVKINVTGKGASYESLKDRISLNSVVFKGLLGKKEVVKYLGQSDIVLMNIRESVIPGMNNKFFDYMWAAKPILASCKGEMADLIRNEKLGYVYKFGDKDDFLKGIEYLRDPRVREEISRNMKKIYKEKFSTDKIYAKYADFVETTF